MIKIWGWEKKTRTMLRYIKIGDIFCFKYDEHTYCFGRIVAKVTFYIAEIFDYTSEQPIISENEIYNSSRLTIIPLDAYSLFDRKIDGEWRVIAHQENYIPEHMEDIWFSWGIGSGCRKSNVFDDTVFISEEEWKTIPPLSPNGDYLIKREVAAKLGK